MILKLSEPDQHGRVAQINLLRPPYVTEGLTATLLGNKGCGKSNTLAVLCEEAHSQQLPFVFFDPNGDANSLAELGNDVIVIGQVDHYEEARRAFYPLEMGASNAAQLIDLVLDEGYSLVIDLTEAVSDELPYIVMYNMLYYLFKVQTQKRTPVLLIIDECHLYAPQNKGNNRQTMTKSILNRIASDGRKRGIMLITATQRMTALTKDIISKANLLFFGKISHFDDYRNRVKPYIDQPFRTFEGLRSGHLFIKSENRSGLVYMKRRKTTDLGATPKIVATEKKKARPDKRNLQISLPLDLATNEKH